MSPLPPTSDRIDFPHTVKRSIAERDILTPRDLRALTLVNRSWQVAAEPVLWRQLALLRGERNDILTQARQIREALIKSPRLKGFVKELWFKSFERKNHVRGEILRMLGSQLEALVICSSPIIELIPPMPSLRLLELYLDRNQEVITTFLTSCPNLNTLVLRLSEDTRRLPTAPPVLPSLDRLSVLKVVPRNDDMALITSILDKYRTVSQLIFAKPYSDTVSYSAGIREGLELVSHLPNITYLELPDHVGLAVMLQESPNAFDHLKTLYVRCKDFDSTMAVLPSPLLTELKGLESLSILITDYAKSTTWTFDPQTIWKSIRDMPALRTITYEPKEGRPVDQEIRRGWDMISISSFFGHRITLHEIMYPCGRDQMGWTPLDLGLRSLRSNNTIGKRHKGIGTFRLIEYKTDGLTFQLRPPLEAKVSKILRRQRKLFAPGSSERHRPMPKAVHDLLQNALYDTMDGKHGRGLIVF